MSSVNQIKKDEVGGVSERENAYGIATEKRTCARHCKRFWWIYLILFIIIALLVILLVIFVGVPHIAQQKINEATLTVEGITITNSQTESFTMSINSTIRQSSSVSATIDAFTGDLYLEDLEPHTPFAQLNFPQTQSEAVVTVNITQNVPITTNLDALTTFNTWLLNNESLRVTVSGNTKVRVSGISTAFGVLFQKTFTLAGLNKFNGQAITQSTISISNETFSGWATIPNPSTVAFDIGNATFNNYLLGQLAGNLTINNFFLNHGNNNVSVHAQINAAPVLSALGRTPYCTNGNLPFALIGQSVVNYGQPLPYFANALAQLNSSVEVPVGSDLAAQNFTIKCPSS